MMRLASRCLLSTVLFVLAFAAGIADASISIYTFSGSLTSVSDPTGLIAASGLSVGSPVSYSVALDFAVDGTYTNNGGSTITKADTPTLDFFFADYLGGDALPVPPDPAFTAPANVAEYNHAFDHLSGGNSIATMNSQNNVLSITVLGGQLSSLAVGDSGIRMDNRVWFQDNGALKTAFVVSNNMMLTSITAAAIPEPGSLIAWSLLGAVGVTMGWCQRRLVPAI